MDTTLDCCNESVNGGRHFYECGCTLYLSTMLLVHCPLHAAAEEMRTKLNEARAGFAVIMNHTDGPVHKMARMNYEAMRDLLASIGRG